MNQQCKVCGEPAAGFHFGAFTCEGCKVISIFYDLPKLTDVKPYTNIVMLSRLGREYRDMENRISKLPRSFPKERLLDRYKKQN